MFREFTVKQYVLNDINVSRHICMDDSRRHRSTTIVEPCGRSMWYRDKYTRSRDYEYKCVQKSGDSRVFAHHTAYRGLLRPSSLRESSHPSLRVFRMIWLYYFKCWGTIRKLVLFIKNDPSAGSPTDTVIRLLHPLDDKAHDTSLRRAIQSISNYNGPCNLPDHPIGWSDGRCEQRAGT